MTKKHWEIGRLHVFIGTSSRVGIELMYDYKEVSLVIHVANAWLVFEWWPEEIESYWR